MVASGRIGEMIEGQYSNYVLQKIMDTAPTTVAQDLMVLLRYGDKGTVKKIMAIVQLSWRRTSWSYSGTEIKGQ